MVTGKKGIKVNRKETATHYDRHGLEICWLISVIFPLSTIHDDLSFLLSLHDA
jgi:hypothetical protein